MQIAQGTIDIDLHDEDALAGLRAIEAEFQRTMNKIDREHAEASVGADLSELKRDLAKAKAELKAFEKYASDAETRMTKDARLKRVSAAEATVKGIEDQIKARDKELKAIQNENKELVTTERRIAAVQKREELRNRTLEQSERRRMSAINAEARRSAGLAKQKEREGKAAEAAAYREESARNRVIAANEKEIRQLPTIKRQYAELAQSVDRLGAARRKARTDTAKTTIDLKVAEAEAKMSALEKTLERHEVDIPVKLHPGRDFGLRIRTAYDQAFERGHPRVMRGMLAGFTEMGRAGGQRASSAFVDTFTRDNLRNLRPTRLVARGGAAALGGIASGAGKIASIAGNLSEMTVRLGPFTATIRQVALAMSLLGPTIVDVLGATVALGGAVGAAALGVGALGVGLAGGLIPAALGTFMVLKPLVKEFTNASKASQAYNDAVLKYGEDSPQAAKKLEQFNNVMKGQSASTKEAFLEFGKMRGEWAKLTKPGRKSAFDAVGEGLKTASALMPQFAKRTNETMDIASRATQKWMRGLRSPEGKGLLDTMFGNFNKFLGPVLDGLGNVGVYLGRVGAIASSVLPELGQGFQKWSKGLMDTSAQDGFREKVLRMVDAARTAGRLLMSFGRLMKTIFAGGAGAGLGLMTDLTNAMNRWNASLKTAEGQEGLHNFFSRAAEGSKAFFAALTPVLTTFVAWSSALSPFATMFFKGAAAVGNIVNALLRMTALRGPVTALAFTLGSMWAVGKIASAAAAVRNFTAAILGLTGAQAAAARVGAIGAGAAAGRGLLAAEAGGAAAGGAAAARTGLAAKAANAFAIAASSAALSQGKLGGATRTAMEAMTVFRGATLAGGAALGGYLAVAVAGGLVIDHFATKSGTLSDKLAQANHLMDAGQSSIQNLATAYGPLRTQTAAVGQNFAMQRLSLRQAKTALDGTKKGTQEYQAALLNYRSVMMQSIQAQNDWRRASDAVKLNLAGQVGAARNARDEYLKLIGGQASSAAQATELANRNRVLENAQARQAAGVLNLQRAYQGMVPVAGSAELALGRLARTARGASVAQKIALKFEAPKDVGAVAAKANAALKAGVSGKIVTKAVVDSETAEQALRRLNAAIDRVKAFKRIRVQVQDGATSIINAIDGAVDALKGKKITVAARDAATSIVNGVKAAARGIRNVSFTISAIAGSALSAINSVRAGIASINSKTVTLTTVHQTIGHPNPYRGGVVANGAVAAARGMGFTERAAQRAATTREEPARSGMRNRPRFLVGEENRKEYIIATNPAYRNRNEKFLGMAASDLGYAIIPAVSGFSPRNVSYTSPGMTAGAVPGPNVPGRRSSRQTPFTLAPTGKKPGPDERARGGHYVIPERVFFGGEEEEPWKTKLDARQQQLDDINRRIKDAQGDERRTKGPKRRGEGAGEYRRRKRDYNKAHLFATKKGPAMRRKATIGRNSAKTVWNSIHAVNVELERLQNMANAERNTMETASSKKPTPDVGTYNAAKGRRLEDLTKARDILQKARDVAQAGGAYQAKLDSDLSSIVGDIQTTEQEEGPGGPPKTIEEFLAATGQTGEAERRQAMLDIAGTTATPDDDRSAAQSLLDFYQGVFGQVQAQQPGNWSLIGAAAQAVNNARSTFEGLSAPTQDEAAIFEQQKTTISNLQRDKAISDSFAQVAGGPGDINDWRFASGRAAAEGRTSAPPGGVTVQINALHPADPKILQDIGDAAASGFGYQGNISSPRLNTGL